MNEGFQFYDMFATKGIEYLAVIAFLLLFTGYWIWLNRRQAPNTTQPSTSGDWFHIYQDRFYHPGHSWAMPQKDGTVKIGLDEFAKKMIGGLDKLVLPGKSRLRQGDSDLQLELNNKRIPFISPVDGEIIEVNKNSGEDWLVRLKPQNLRPDLRNLLQGSLARLWMRSEVSELNRLMGNRLGLVLQDGGALVNGFARELDAKNWDRITRRFLRTDDL